MVGRAVKIKTEVRPPDGSVYGPHSFDTVIGDHVPLTAGDSMLLRARVIAVTVSPGGHSAELTLSVDGLALAVLPAPTRVMRGVAEALASGR